MTVNNVHLQWLIFKHLVNFFSVSVVKNLICPNILRPTWIFSLYSFMRKTTRTRWEFSQKYLTLDIRFSNSNEPYIWILIKSFLFQTTFKYELIEELKFVIKFSGSIKPVKRQTKSDDGSEILVKDDVGSIRSAKSTNSHRSHRSSRNSSVKLSDSFAKK